ncbi:hypothetical protein OBBRIDRAFT_838298 [Obba rivulosa]|uniref:F-box domain-containing protein n=1 Tax=Obba rivulosa TaxID=1052685 RepID=A0A8E2AKP8_9APHY|nr:hypothetical protein OBBRIDRAFT_838298 [Obba rivulosa]
MSRNPSKLILLQYPAAQCAGGLGYVAEAQAGEVTNKSAHEPSQSGEGAPHSRLRSTATPPMAATSLPPELSEHIIDFLEDDRAALLACAATWSGWTPFCRKHLFRAVSLTDDRFAQFVTILASSPYVGKFVRALDVAFRCDDAEIDAFVHLKAIVPRLGRVEEFCYTSDHRALPEISVFQHLGPVVRLVLCDGGSLRQYGDLAQFLGNFPLVEDLELRCGEIDDESREHLPALTLALQRMPLRRLVVQNTDIMPVIADCISRFPKPQLASLTLKHTSLPDGAEDRLPPFDPYIRWSKLQLQHLHIDIRRKNSTGGPRSAHHTHQTTATSAFTNYHHSGQMGDFLEILRSCGHMETVHISSNMMSLMDVTVQLVAHRPIHFLDSDEFNVTIYCETSWDFELLTSTTTVRALLVITGILSARLFRGRKTFTVQCDYPGDREAYIKARDWVIGELAHLEMPDPVSIRFEGIPET